MEATVTRFEVTWHVAADPAGVALLLSEPASWRDPDHEGYTWTVAAPHRVASRFTAAAELTASTERLATGQMTVKPSTEAGCEVRMVLRTRDAAAARSVEQSALLLLASLAERAQARSLAA
jgi:hypothetical protein